MRIRGLSFSAFLLLCITIIPGLAIAATYLLTADVDPPGSGTLAFNPTSANGRYQGGEIVWITATPNSGYVFGNWTGDASGFTNPVTVTMDADKSVTANMRVTHQLTAGVSPPGSGTFAFSPASPGNIYAEGETVWITAVPNAGWIFVNWTGDASGTANPVMLAIDADKNVTANMMATYVLTGSANPPGSGTLAFSPTHPGNIYNDGETVWISAAPGAGWTFINWTGAASGTDNPVMLTMDVNNDITANFADTAPPSSTITAPPKGAQLLDTSCTITGTATDYLSGIQTVEVSVDGGSNWSFVNYTSVTWGYDWTPLGVGGYTILSRATDTAGNIETPSGGTYVIVTAQGPNGSPELAHYDWGSFLTGGDCSVCHAVTATFLQSDFRQSPGFCHSCHNATATAHDKNVSGKSGHPVFASVTSRGCIPPSYGNISSAEWDNRPFANLYDTDKLACITCHNPMRKTEDVGRVWEYTMTSDNQTYTMQGGGWSVYGHMEPVVYRDSSLWSGPTYVREKKAYAVEPSEYVFNPISGTVTFTAPMDPSTYVYVTLDFPYLRASSYGNRLCSDCHVEQTHVSHGKALNCLDCHTSHNTSNIMLVREDVQPPTMYGQGPSKVVFRGYTGANSFVDGNPAHDGICEVCHTETFYYRYNGTGFSVHTSTGLNYNGFDCTACHKHRMGFVDAGGSCKSCHGTGGSGVGGENNRRNIEAEFRRNSHHINATWASVDTASCAACHAEGNYADGSINVTYHKDGTVHLKQWTGTLPATGTNGTFIALAYSDEASATNHCMSCHNNTNASATPFSASGDYGTPGSYDVASGGTNAGSINTRYNNVGSTIGTNTTYFSKYSPVTNNVVPQLTKAYSPHGNAANNERGVATTGSWSDDGGSTNVACYDCHNAHGSDVGSGTVMNSYSSMVGGWSGGLIKSTASYTPSSGSGSPVSWAASSDLCWDCHLGDDATSPKDFNTGFNNSAPIAGYYDGAGRWTAVNADDWNPSFSYKTAGTTGGKNDGQQKGGHFGTSSALSTTPSNNVSGRCTVCHDPHGVNPSKTNAEYMVPALKGAWMTSPYKEDRAPGTQGINFSQNLTGMDSIWYVYYTARSGDATQWKPTRLSPRFDISNPPIIGAGYGAGISGSTNWDVGGTGGDGYFIDDNTFGTNITYGSGSNRLITDVYTTGNNGERPWGLTTITANRISETDTQFAGLCLGCHLQADLEAVSYSNGTDTIKVHNTVKGWYSSANAADLFKDSQAAEHLMSYYNSDLNSNAMRCTYGIQGVTPYVMPAGYRWSVVPGATPCTRSTHTVSNPPYTANTQTVLGYKQPAFHQFPCSKCHSAHTSKLPRLMKTNCLDVGPSSSYPKHRGVVFDYPESCDQGYADNAGVLVDVMMQCHNLKRSNMPGAGGWNTKTGW